ncbi:hypothetical protein EDB85DRAFT_2271892 [Lactarius pseudohatsudake]|nr:hypothetical protein EDB85DRAFT_2271892 [Lactarius pseudohatsudake]
MVNNVHRHATFKLRTRQQEFQYPDSIRLVDNAVFLNLRHNSAPDFVQDFETQMLQSRSYENIRDVAGFNAILLITTRLTTLELLHYNDILVDSQAVDGLAYAPNQTAHVYCLLRRLTSGTVVVTPVANTAKQVFGAIAVDPGFSHAQSIQTQFLEGVLFLHEHGIAQLDLKPADILVDERHPTKRPGWKASRGTSPWVAPEVEKQMNPQRSAARSWPTGGLVDSSSQSRTLQRLRPYAPQLPRSEPSERPPLLDRLPGINAKMRRGDSGCAPPSIRAQSPHARGAHHHRRLAPFRATNIDAPIVLFARSSRSPLPLAHIPLPLMCPILVQKRRVQRGNEGGNLKPKDCPQTKRAHTDSSVVARKTRREGTPTPTTHDMERVRIALLRPRLRAKGDGAVSRQVTYDDHNHKLEVSGGHRESTLCPKWQNMMLL